MLQTLFHKLTLLITPTIKNILHFGKEFSKAEKLFLVILFLFFPSNLARRFVLSNAYVRGVLVDYLIPTLYLTEAVVLVLLLVNAIRQVKLKLPKLRVTWFLPLAFLPSIVVGKFSLPSLFRLVELSLWIGFAFWISRNISWQKDHRPLVKILSLGVSWVSLLAIAQFITQKNIFGYYFLGEPIIYPSLGGVACTSFLGQEVLRAYGTFPHPNVLGGAMAILVPWLLAGGLFVPAGLGVFALFVSFSRLAWIAFALGVLILVISKVNVLHRLKFIALAFFVLLTAAFLLFPAATDLSVVRRIELLQSAKEMFLRAPFTGIGLGLFTVELSSFTLPSGPTLFLQPVHNIFALVAAESGFFAFVIFLLLFFRAFYVGLKKRRILLLLSLLQLTLLGFFDHYLYTLPQGLFLLSLTFGLLFSYSDGDGR